MPMKLSPELEHPKQPKHWWEDPELYEAYHIRLDNLRLEMRNRFKVKQEERARG